jgi:hypothetical protein
MNNDEAQTPKITVMPGSCPTADFSLRPWWKPHRRTCVIFLVAAGSIAVLGALIFGGRDGSGDAAGQGLAAAFEAAFFVLGVILIVSVALVMWLSRYFRTRTIIMGILGFVVLIVLSLMR